jgi:hypothetical protein
MEETEAFHPDTVFAHEDGRYLVFVDLKSVALLLFDGRSASLLALPDEVVKESDVTKAATRTCVACSQGSICVLHMDHHHGEVTLWSLREQPQQWVRVFQIQSDEILWSDHSLGTILSLVCAEMMMGPLDPTNQYKLTIYAPRRQHRFHSSGGRQQALAEASQVLRPGCHGSLQGILSGGSSVEGRSHSHCAARPQERRARELGEGPYRQEQTPGHQSCETLPQAY